MILIQVIQLAAEFLNHALAIVLIGFLSVELALCRHRRYNSKMKRAIIILFAMSLLGGALMLFEFFVGRGAIQPDIFLHVPGITGLLYVLFAVRRLGPALAPKRSFNWLLGSLFVILILTVLYIFTQSSMVIFFSTLAQTAAAISFYFYALGFLIAGEKAESSIP